MAVRNVARGGGKSYKESVVGLKDLERKLKALLPDNPAMRADLKKLMDDGKFHHATYRYDFARGWHIYQIDPTGFRGFNYVAAFSEVCCPKEELEAVRNLVRNTGYSTGSYGNG